MNNHDTYSSPLSSRYASDEMLYNFSDNKKFRTWRQMWISLAEREKELGIDISDEQIAELKANAENINYETAAAFEKKFRHDVMAHVHTFGEAAPNAKGIIHLGATSAFVGDNTDLVQIRDGLLIIRKRLISVINALALFAKEYAGLPTLGFTHFQSAQPTTVGKRATLWLYEFLTDLEELEFNLETLRFRGVKGTTGTQASFVQLFNGDNQKIDILATNVAKDMGFDEVIPVTGQTYSRKTDARSLTLMSALAQSASKFANDIRLLQHKKEIEEPFEKNQIGSSAMAYKRNPMRSERICALSRYVIVDSLNPAFTAATQWFERTLDDSANKRIAIPEAFLAVDAILSIVENVASGLVVHEKVIEKHLNQELPFMMTEDIMMEASKHGADRQELHEKIREFSMMAATAINDEGKDNPLLDLIANEPLFTGAKDQIETLKDAKRYTGRAEEQTHTFLDNWVKPFLDKYADEISSGATLKV